MKRRLFKAGTALVLAASMLSLTACGGSETAETVSSETASSTSAEADDASRDSSAEGILSRDFSEHMDITYASPQVESGLDYNTGNEYYAWWTDTFNVTWDITALTWENWISNVRTWASTDDLPDWTVFNFVAADAISYAEQGLVMKWPEDWKEKYPNLAKAAEYSPANAYYEEALGGMYYFFRPTFANNFPAEEITEHTSIYLRKDWAEQAGYDLSEMDESSTITLSQFVDYLRAVKEAGIVEYPWYSTNTYVGMAVDRTSEGSGCLQTAFQPNADGEYVWSPGDENSGIKESLAIVKEAYDEGLLYPEFYTLQSAEDLGHFATAGDSAALVYSTDVGNLTKINDMFSENLGVDFKTQVGVYVLTDDNGVEHEAKSLNYWGASMLSPHMSEEKLDRILTMWDYSCTEEGQLRIRMGEQGTDWDYDESGNLVNLLADTEYGDAATKYTNLYPLTGCMTILGDDFSLIDPSQDSDLQELICNLYTARSDATNAKEKELDDVGMSYASPNAAQATFTYWDEYSNLITQSGDFSANYDQWVADKSPMTQRVVDDMNEYAAGLTQ